MSLSDLPNVLTTHNPNHGMASLSLFDPVAPMAFFGLFSSAGATQGLMCLLMFPCACPWALGTPSPFDMDLHAFSDEITGSSSPTTAFPNTTFNPHDATHMVTVPNDPNRFIGTIDTNGGNSLPLLASGIVDTKDVNIPSMIWVLPQCIHLCPGHCLAPRAVAVASVLAFRSPEPTNSPEHQKTSL